LIDILGHFIHIGLGKVASSTMQNSVFPLIKELRPTIKYVAPGYNDEILELIKEYLKDDCCDDTFMQLDKYLTNSNLLLSWEGLNSWDPRYWEMSAKKILKLFGKDTTILILVRDTMNYYRSLYQQVLATGDVIMPENFFMSKEGYDETVKENNCYRIRVFDVDSYNVESLYNIYKNSFSNIYMVPLAELSSLNFLIKHFKLSDNEQTCLIDKYSSIERLNKSYSSFAMSIIFFRQKLLYFLFINRDGLIKSKYLSKYNKLTVKQKIIQIPYRILRNIRVFDRLLRVITKLIPSKKYRLPKHIYLNRNQMIKNDQFINKFSNEI
jgi:hypothetical protein